MPVTPISARAVACDVVRNMVANCSTFIDAVGASDYNDAKSRVYLVEKFPDAEDVVAYTRPLCLVLMAMFEYKVSRPGYPLGSHEFQLEIDAITEVDGDPATPEDQALHAFNFFGGIESELSQLGSPIASVTNDANLRFDRLVQVLPIQRSRDTGQQDFWRCRYSFQLF